MTSLQPGLVKDETVFPIFGMWVTRRWREDCNYNGMALPKRFGYAFYNFDRDVQLYFLYPFNFIIALVRRVYIATRWEIPMEFKEYERKWRAHRNNTKAD